MLTRQQAEQFAHKWLQAWNTKDLNAIMQHYANALEFYSPQLIAHKYNTTGVLHSKAELEIYFAAALRKYPNLQFRLINVCAGLDSIGIVYHSINNSIACEVLFLNDAGKVCKCYCHYAAALL